MDNSPSYHDFIYFGGTFFNSIVLPGNEKAIFVLLRVITLFIVINMIFLQMQFLKLWK